MIPYSDKDKKIIAVITILSGLLALACMVVGLVATQHDAEAFTNPVKIMDMPDININLIRWFMLLDMFGYYLLLLPAVFFIHQKLTNKTPWATFFTSLGFGYVMIGAIGAAALSVVWPSLLEKCIVAAPTVQEIYKADFSLATDFVVKGLWNYLEVLVCGVWWIGVGYFAIENRVLKITTFVLGTACLVDGIGELLRLPLVAEIGLNIYLILGIAWPVWIGIALWKNKL